MPTMVVSKLRATVGKDTAKILLAVPARKLPSAALIKSNQLGRESIDESLTLPSPSRDCVTMRKSHECHSEPQAKNLTISASCKSEILRLPPQDDIATQSLEGKKIYTTRNPFYV